MNPVSKPLARVFVIRMSAIGDVVMTTRALSRLQARGVEPVLVTSPGLADIARCMPFLRYFVTIESERVDAYAREPQVPLWRTISFSELLAPEGAPASASILDLQKTARSRRARTALSVACRAAGTPLEVTTFVAKHTLWRSGLVLWAWIRAVFLKQKPLAAPAYHPRTDTSRHSLRGSVHASQAKAVDTHLAKLNIGHASAVASPSPSASASVLSPHALFHAEPLAEGTPLEVCGRPLLPKRYVCLVPGASGFVKQWPKESYRKLAGLLLNGNGLNDISSVVVLGGAGERALGRYLAMAPECAGRDIRDATGQLSLRQTFRVLENAAHVFTNDTFASHVADLAGVPATLFFGGTSPAFGFLPLSPKVIPLFENLACSPCTRHGLSGCRYGNLRCLKDITPEKALRTLDREAPPANLT